MQAWNIPSSEVLQKTIEKGEYSIWVGEADTKEADISTFRLGRANRAHGNDLVLGVAGLRLVGSASAVNKSNSSVICVLPRREYIE